MTWCWAIGDCIAIQYVYCDQVREICRAVLQYSHCTCDTALGWAHRVCRWARGRCAAGAGGARRRQGRASARASDRRARGKQAALACGRQARGSGRKARGRGRQARARDRRAAAGTGVRGAHGARTAGAGHGRWAGCWANWLCTRCTWPVFDPI